MHALHNNSVAFLHVGTGCQILMLSTQPYCRCQCHAGGLTAMPSAIVIKKQFEVP